MYLGTTPQHRDSITIAVLSLTATLVIYGTLHYLFHRRLLSLSLMLSFSLSFSLSLSLSLVIKQTVQTSSPTHTWSTAAPTIILVIIFSTSSTSLSCCWFHNTRGTVKSATQSRSVNNEDKVLRSPYYWHSAVSSAAVTHWNSKTLKNGAWRTSVQTSNDTNLPSPLIPDIAD